RDPDGRITLTRTDIPEMDRHFPAGVGREARMKMFLMTKNPGMDAVRSFFRTRDASIIAEQIHIASIPAPTGGESARGAYVAQRFEEAGLKGVTTDDVGNVIGRFPGVQEGEAPVVVAAHLDSVFPGGVEVSPRADGSRILAPGI